MDTVFQKPRKTAPLDKERVRRETQGINEQVHLLACGSALMPQAVVDSVISYTTLEAKIGGYEAQAATQQKSNLLYDCVANHIGAQLHEIAITQNASEAWQRAFYALPLKLNSRIITCEAEYAANYVALLQRAKREGLKIDIAPSDSSGQIDLDALDSMMDEDVSLIAITWIPTNGGLINPVEGVGKIARKYAVPYLLDGCQAVGQIKIDVQEIGCDFFSATGRKFLRGPRGTGFLYVREKWLETLEPAMIDHFGAPWVTPDKYALRKDARRFETWESSYALRAGLCAAVSYANDLGIEAIQQEVNNLATHCRTLLSENNKIELLDLGRHKCGIVSFSVEGRNARKIVTQMNDAGFVIGASPASSTLLDSTRRNLPTLLRIAPHYYNTKDEISRTIEHLNYLID